MAAPVVKIRYMRADRDSDIPLPRYMTPHAAGMDICAAVPEPVDMGPGDIVLIPTGFAVAVPPEYEAQIRPRSGLALRHGITLINAPGTIDADYRGEVMVPLINLGRTLFTVRRGERIAQMVINQICQVRLNVVPRLDETERNTGGFGHTGV
ncbi:deoxyuridine 5'-triphosphate nucleotidohydrolase [Desulfonema ishimotonii]|uniref:Deoxyuridine 5'-triphosphate nucleotidohydrolase n=1 Tax=Desulfonema ishimotonii TaxID=45657 RepID=A0A401G3X4_9BACT|nr:dUTP diphosphatase [Desulfonema ishimotonii]GBC63916.1 deoxyuridine 5'-triphosphate nucleotidohydrolase [Desulfonema ishimotonii]